MWIDICLIVYVVLLIPYINQCEKINGYGFKCLIIGILITPILGYFYIWWLKRKTHKSSFI